MKIFNIQVGTGKLCGLVATALFFAAMLLAFPGIIPAVFATAIKYAVPSLMIGGAGVAFVCGLMALEKRIPGILRKFLEKSEEYVGIALVCIAIAIGGGGLFAFTVLEFRVLASSWAVIQGTSIDSNGTIIPISPIAVIALHIAVLMGAVCFGRHFLYPNCEIERKWIRIMLSAVVAFVLMAFVSGTVGKSIRYAYLDDTAEKKMELMEKIGKQQESLDTLKKELLQLEAAGK